MIKFTGRIFKAVFIICTITISFCSFSKDIWQSKGYGYVFDLSDSTTPIIYDITNDHCLLNHFLTEEATRDGISIDKIKGLLDFDKLFPLTVTKLNAIPKACVSIEQRTFQSDGYVFNAYQTLDILLSNFSYHYAFSDYKAIDWKLLKSHWLKRVNSETTPEQLQSVIDDFLKTIRDGHAILFNQFLERVAYYTPRESKSEKRLRDFLDGNTEFTEISQVYQYVYKRWLKNIESYFAVDSPTQKLADNFLFAKLKGGGTYFRIDSFDEHGTKKVMEEVTPHFVKSKGLIIDLRDSSGGSDLVALKIMAYLIDQQVRVGSKSFKLSTGMSDKKDIFVFPEIDKPFVGKIVVISSEQTPSAAEFFLMALKARNHVTIIGENSRGAMSDALTKALPNGWGISISNEKYMDERGNNYEFTGIPVEESFEFPNLLDIEKSRDSALEYAIELINN